MSAGHFTSPPTCNRKRHAPKGFSFFIMKTQIGSVFGFWTVKERLGSGKVLCTCRCGIEKPICISNLTSGKTKSCGCISGKLIAASMTKHGMYGTPTYKSWSSMMTRCYNKKCKSFPRYGGRGILVCDRWHDFANFFADMGEKPLKGMSIERLDNNIGYKAGNCIWATPTIQGRNTRRVKLNPVLALEIKNGAISRKDVLKNTGCADSTFYAARSGKNWKAI